MADKLKKAIMAIILPTLAPLGFRRQGARNLMRVENDIVQKLYFQLSGGGGRDFRVTCCANLIPANDFATLQPGFELGSGRWLPYLTQQDAEDSVALVLRWITADALPFFERTRTLADYAQAVANQNWGSSHHGKFQRGVAMAHMGRSAEAGKLLREARSQYLEDGRPWVGDYIARIDALSLALQMGGEVILIQKWIADHQKAHGL